MQQTQYLPTSTSQVTDKSGPWLNGWSDVVANIKILPGCIKLVDTRGNANSNLVIADQDLRLICFQGTQINSEVKLSEKPVCLTYFYTEQSQIMVPIIAVASGSNVYMYKQMKSFYRLTIPKIEMGSDEKKVWQSYNPENITKFISELTKLKAADYDLCYKTLDVLGYTSTEKQIEVAQEHFEDGLELEDSITCLDVMKRGTDDEYAIGQLLIGTEYKCFYALQASGAQVSKAIRLSGTPIAITCFQIGESEVKCCVLLRENAIVVVKNGEFEDGQKIDLESKPIQMIKQDQSFFVSMMNQSIQCYTLKQGFQRMFSLSFTSGIVYMESLEYGRSKQVKGLLVALKDNTIRLHIDKVLVNTIQLEFCVSAMKFGIFGREDGFLIIIDEKGGIETKILQRQFNQQSQVLKQLAQSKEQEQRDVQQINIPRKTKLFIEQAKRERDQGPEIHRGYQYDLLRMRLKTAQTYLSVLEDDGIPAQLSTGVGLRIQAQVEGLGPIFKINGVIENLGGSSVTSLRLSYQFNDEIFQMVKATQKLSYLLPGVLLNFSVLIKNIDEQGQSDIVKIFLFCDQKLNPLLGAIVQIPMSELSVV